MAPKALFFFLPLLLSSLETHPSAAQTSWMRSGYWFYGTESPVSDINSALFTHLICAFADLNSSTHAVSVPPNQHHSFSTFSVTVRRKNPSLTTLLSFGGANGNSSAFSSMAASPSSRKTFIDSAIQTARLYGFNGIDLSWPSSPDTAADMANLGTLLDEWPSNSSSNFTLTMAVDHSPVPDPDDVSVSYPVESMVRSLDWVHVMALDYYTPSWANFTAPHAALFDPTRDLNTDFGVRAWIGRGMPAEKMLLCLPFYGYAWRLVNQNDTGIGAAASGPGISEAGDRTYKEIKEFIETHEAGRRGGDWVDGYNGTYVVNYFAAGGIWIGFDDVEAISAKVSYAREKGLLGYTVWQIAQDRNWVLSVAAQGGVKDGAKRSRVLLIVLLPTAMALPLLGLMVCYALRRARRLKGHAGMRGTSDPPKFGGRGEDPNLQVFGLASLEVATDGFSIENKLGAGGYGPVYKGKLPNGQDIAVKRLSRTSKQGLDEFKNEVTLTAKLQHVNLVRVLGFCTQREEKMLIYEYMPNKSLDFYIFDPIRQLLLDWNKRVQIIEGVTQGLLYLQEYSRLTIIHRDLKASNILLDREMKPKISDFGMAKIFQKDEDEEEQIRVVGTYGYVPPECVREGAYSMKSDVYSFGVLLLQIISGKKVYHLYGAYENLNLSEYAYELWKDGKGVEFMEPSLDDGASSCKLLVCMQVALLCVQESPADRPSMLEVSSLLKNENAAISYPKSPAFSRKRDESNVETSSGSRQEICSLNHVTISEVFPR